MVFIGCCWPGAP